MIVDAHGHAGSTTISCVVWSRIVEWIVVEVMVLVGAVGGVAKLVDWSGCQREWWVVSVGCLLVLFGVSASGERSERQNRVKVDSIKSTGWPYVGRSRLLECWWLFCDNQQEHASTVMLGKPYSSKYRRALMWWWFSGDSRFRHCCATWTLIKTKVIERWCCFLLPGQHHFSCCCEWFWGLWE